MVNLKTKIQNANAPIADKIFRLGEVKNLISRIRGLDTKSGTVRDRYRTTEETITYVAYMDLFTKDNLIKGWEEEIEQLQEEIEACRSNCAKKSIALNADSIKTLIGNFVNFGNSYLSRKEI